ncbi:MAG: ZIP family metal transporter [Gemmataceae bacterium]
MTTAGWLTLYCAAVLAASLFGGYVPFLGRVSHSRLQMYLSLSAGVMLGASFFHVMPDAMELAGSGFGWWMALGVVGLFCIERFIAPHSHEVSSKLQQEHDHEPGCEHDHEHRAAPTVAGWMAVLGLTIHTFMNGVGLAGAIKRDIEKGSGYWIVPGFALFLAIVLHKPADALAISTVLSRKGVSRGKITLVQIGFATMVAVGAISFLLIRETVERSLRDEMTGAALAFSAGTFLFIALSDLLPEVQFHRHDRVPLSLALILGVVLMGCIALLEGDEHGGHDHDEGGAAAHHHGGDHDTDGSGH